MTEHSANLPENPALRDLAALQAQMQRPAQTANRDGGFELGWGIAVLCFGLTSYFNAVVTKWVRLSPWLAWITFLPLLCAAFAPYAVPKLIKRFITWPRTGYVAQLNELKLSQLVRLMVFGGALGGTIGLLLVLVVQVLEIFGQPGAHPNWHTLALKAIKLLVCAAVTVYLGPKVIRKPSPLPAAYNAAAVTQGLRQTATGRKTLRVVRGTLLAMFVGLPLLVGGIVLALMYWNKSLMHHAEIRWSQLGLPGFLVATNALLYFMGSGMVLKPHRWKWFMLPVMLLAPILVAPAIPYPVAQAGLIPLFEPMPPVMLCLGMVWCLSGAITLILFVRHNPLPAAEAA